LATKAALSVVPDEGLVVENAGLTEWPVPLLGSFDQAFLAVPREVIQLTMRTNQKYFALTRGHDGPLAPNFICVANIEALDGGDAIAAGNRKVLAARLSDARFFWEQDLKVPLEDQAKKLDQIVFHEKLGTIADKVERVAKLARSLAEQGVVDAPPDEVEQAARLAKADLVTGIVGEFPELQGVMGGHIARVQGASDAIADAIRDHYGTPEAPVSVAVALADKLDVLKQFFAIDERPTGSKDPFALRRAAIQSVAMILRGLRFDLGQFVPRDVIDFIIDRWMVQSRGAGGRPDLIAAVVAASSDGDLLRLNQRMEALASFIGTDEGANLLAGYRRAANILKKEGWDSADSSLSYVPLPEEAALLTALEAAEPEAERAIGAEDFSGAMAALARLRAPIDAFFDKVTVNDPDATKRAARLGMLARVRDAVHRVADFSRIEG
jgi:glycyl-tRNA synthetase beta chain